jgi:hypothetical protein
MTPAVACGVPAGPGLLEGYLGHLQTLGLGDRAVRDRVRIARDFTGRYPDLQAWMTLPAAHRVSELKRTGAWPLVCHAIGAGQLRLDLELAGAKNLAGLARAVEARDPEAFAAARAAGLRLGWQATWTETVLGECLAVLLAWHGGHARDLTSEIVDAFDTGLAACRPGGPTAAGSREYGSCCSRPASPIPRLSAGHGPAPWNSGSPMWRCPRRSGGYCCDTSRPGPRYCGPSPWRAWSTTCSRSPNTSPHASLASPHYASSAETTSRDT